MRALLAVASCVVVACGSFGAATTDGTSDGGPSTTSGGTSGPDGSSSADGAVSDGGPVVDFCADKRADLFCSGFDVGPEPYGLVPGSGALPFVYGEGVDASRHSVRFSALMGDVTDRSFSWTSSDKLTASTIVVRLKMNIAAVAADSDSSDARLIEIKCTGGNYARLKLKASGKLQLQTSSGDDITDNAATLQTWGDVQAAWNVSGGSFAVGTSLTGGTSCDAPAACTAPFTVSLGFSDWANPPKGPYDVLFDNVEVIAN